MADRETIKLLFAKVTDEATQRNFQLLRKTLAEMALWVVGKTTPSVALVAGDNVVSTIIARPTGRILVYQDAAATLFDKGSPGLSQWTINASAPCNCKFIFF